MADKSIPDLTSVQDVHIGDLPTIADIYDNTLIPVAQQGMAQKMTGAQFKNYAKSSVSGYANSAAADANTAKNAMEQANSSAQAAQAARDEIQNMSVSSKTLPAGSDATATKSAGSGSFHIEFGIPRGEAGMNGVALSAEGIYAFNVNADGHLVVSYTGETPPAFTINNEGHLIYNF